MPAQASTRALAAGMPRVSLRSACLILRRHYRRRRRVVYLARLREAFGRGGEIADRRRDAPTVPTVADALRERGGAWCGELAPGRAVRVAVNHDLAAAGSRRVREGDEVALLPPVTGG